MNLSRRLRQLLGYKRVAIAEACLIGVVSGLSAVFLKQGIEWLTQWRIDQDQVDHAWYLLPMMGMLGAWGAGWLVQQFAPEASGSGISGIKAVLAHKAVALNLRVAVVKLISTVMALGSGLSLGRQGPTVQIGAALAAQLSRWVPTSPEYRQQLIAAGAAAGLAAGFNAPIAGVLFVVEELLQDFSGLTLGSAILASFIGAVVSRLLGGQGLNLSITTLQTGLVVQDLPFLMLLGALAGLLGAFFSRGIFASLSFFRAMTGVSMPWRIGLAGLITGLVGVLLPIAAQDNTGLRDFLVTGSAHWHIIAIAFVVKFGLTLLAYGSGAPGGIFAPALVLGSALGCLVSAGAQILHDWSGLTMASGEFANATTYALTGMGAFFSAVTRVPITAIVIVFEMTADFNLVLPLMIGSAIAYLISDRISPGSIYTRLLAWQGIELDLTATTSNPWANLTADDLMQRRVETLTSTMPLPEAIQAFSRSHHRGFPVLEDGKLVGIVTQSDLSNADRRQGHLNLADIMTPHPVTVSPEASLTQVLHLLNKLKVSRLPVTDGPKLIGIITRGDIIRAESDQISGKAMEAGPQAEPSYVVYQTRAPATGRGRLLLPLSDPTTAHLLIQTAIAIAQFHRYELECVHVVQVPRSASPAEVAVDVEPGRRLLTQAQQWGEKAGLSVHTQVRTGHEVGQPLLEVIKERHIDLMVMGWQRQTQTPGRVLGVVVDTIIRQAPCDVVLLRPGRRPPNFQNWLVPVAGGPNVRRAMELLPSLINLNHQPDVRLCHVSSKAPSSTTQRYLTQAAQRLESQIPVPVNRVTLQHPQIAEAVVNLAEQTHRDTILLGASREGLLSQVLHGNIPVTIAQHTTCTVVLVRQVSR
ncbi:MAG: chloride channel protein [Cyanobacteria bacterium P01_A01_bin.123]